MTRPQWALWGACVLLELAACVLSALLARRDRGHRPIAVVFGYAVVADVAMRLASALAIEPAPRPLVGSALTLYHAAFLASMAWPAVVAGLVWWTCAGKRALFTGLVLAAWAAAGRYAVGLPLRRTVRLDFLQVYALAAIGVAALAVVLGWARRRERPRPLVVAIVAIELVVATVGPFARDNPWDPNGDWDVARVLYILGFGALVGVQVRWLRSAAR